MEKFKENIINLLFYVAEKELFDPYSELNIKNDQVLPISKGKGRETGQIVKARKALSKLEGALAPIAVGHMYHLQKIKEIIDWSEEQYSEKKAPVGKPSCHSVIAISLLKMLRSNEIGESQNDSEQNLSKKEKLDKVKIKRNSIRDFLLPNGEACKIFNEFKGVILNLDKTKQKFSFETFNIPTFSKDQDGAWYHNTCAALLKSATEKAFSFGHNFFYPKTTKEYDEIIDGHKELIVDAIRHCFSYAPLALDRATNYEYTKRVELLSQKNELEFNSILPNQEVDNLVYTGFIEEVRSGLVKLESTEFLFHDWRKSRKPSY